MNPRIIGLVIKREYLNKVKKKSFLILTFVAPVLFAAMCVIPSLIMLGTKEEAKKIVVLDNSGITKGFLESGEAVTYIEARTLSLDSLKMQLSQNEFDAILAVSDINPLTKSVTADLFSEKPVGVDLTENIENKLDKAVENYRIESYQIEGLAQIMNDVKANVSLKSYTLDEEGKESISESGIYMVVSMILGMIIYMFIAIFGGMVMSSVIEEKSSRIVEVLVSSVKATELMFGKIIGIALVALTQFFLWIVLTVGIIGVVSSVAGKDLLGGQDPSEMVVAIGGADQMTEIVVEAASDEDFLTVATSTFSTMPLGKILLGFVIFFVFGYMLYASMYAAIGSAVESEGDTQQLSLPVTIPLLIGFFIAFYAFKAPDSAIVWWGSMIPFTSPIVMLARLPYGVPSWEIILSIALLIGTFAVMAYFSAKIYKVGILMFGKKSTWKDLMKWLKQN